STRLKTGTATKLALNQITTAAFASAGRVFGPWMIDLARGSAKLRDRAARTVAAACATTPERGRRLLARARGDLRAAIVMGRPDASRRERELVGRVGQNAPGHVVSRPGGVFDLQGKCSHPMAGKLAVIHHAEDLIGPFDFEVPVQARLEPRRGPSSVRRAESLP